MTEKWTTFIQWKGTDLCMDFYCPKCGEHSHFDGMFAYHIECSGCRARWKMPEHVEVEEAAPDATPVLCDNDADEA